MGDRKQPAGGDVTGAEAVRQLLERGARAASDEVTRPGGQLSSDQVGELDRLAKLLQFCRTAEPQLPRRRWPVVVALTATLLIASFLFFTHMPSTEIEVDLRVSEVGFRLRTAEILSDSFPLTALGASGMREVEFPPAAAGAHNLNDSPVRLAVASKGKRSGTLNLATLVLPEETHVSLRKTPVARQFRLSLQMRPGQMQANVYGPIEIGAPGAPPGLADFTAPAGVLLRTGPDDVDLDLEFGDVKGGEMAPQLLVRDISFFSVSQVRDVDQRVVRPVSTVLGGSMYFESLDGLERKLRAGEGLRFESSQGEIRTLRMGNDAIEVAFHGYVQGMATGFDESRRSLMPTRLDWLKARHGVSLLWGTAFYAFSLLAGALRWWGVHG